MLSTDLDSFDALFIPMAVAPAQYYGPRGLSPEQGLLFAVLKDAIRTVRAYRYERRGEGRRLHDQAVAWFKTVGIWEDGFTYEFVCEALGLDMGAVRRAVLNNGNGNGNGHYAR